MKPLTGAIYQVEGIQCTGINTGYIHVVCFLPNSTELYVPRLHMHVIGQINNNLIIINLSSMGLLSFLDNGLSYKNFKQQSQHNSYKCMSSNKKYVLVYSWTKESPLLFCFVSLQAQYQESQKIWTRDRKICLKRQSYLWNLRSWTEILWLSGENTYSTI